MGLIKGLMVGQEHTSVLGARESGNAVNYANAARTKGLMKLDEENVKSQQLQNKVGAAEFLEWQDGRDSRDKQRDAQTVGAKAILGAEDEIISGAKTAQQVKNEQNTRLTDNKEQLDMNFAQQVKFQYDTDKMKFGREQNEALVGIGNFLNEIGVKNITADTYKQVYDSFVQRMGGDPKSVAEHLGSAYGITEEPTPENVSRLYTVSQLAVHDAATSRKEHLARVEAEMSALYSTKERPKAQREPLQLLHDADLAVRDGYEAHLRGDAEGAARYYQAAEDMRNQSNTLMQVENMEAEGSSNEYYGELLKTLPDFAGLDAKGDIHPDTLATVAKAVSNTRSIPGYENKSPQEIANIIRDTYQLSDHFFGTQRLEPKNPEQLAEGLVQTQWDVQQMADIALISNLFQGLVLTPEVEAMMLEEYERIQRENILVPTKEESQLLLEAGTFDTTLPGAEVDVP